MTRWPTNQRNPRGGLDLHCDVDTHFDLLVKRQAKEKVIYIRVIFTARSS